MLSIQKRMTKTFFALLSLPATAMGFALSVQISALSWILSTKYNLNIDDVGLVWASGPVAAVATSGVILSAAYALYLYRRVVFGDLVKEGLKSITDMTAREKAIFAPLVVMTLLLGVYPSVVTDMIGPSVAQLVSDYHAAIPASSEVAEAASH